MALITRFRPPAGITDLPEGSPFYANWHQFLDSRIAAFSEYPPGAFYNASRTDVTVLGDRHLTWMAFPRDLLLPNRRDNRREAYALADERGNQNEYCEWRTERNAAGKITKVTFTCELPDDSYDPFKSIARVSQAQPRAG